MRLVKIFLAIIVMIALSTLLYKNQELNPEPIWIWLYPNFQTSVQLPVLIALTLIAGVCVGFFIALTQIITYKSESRTCRLQNKKLQNELDELRNQSIMDIDDIVLRDSNERVEL